MTLEKIYELNKEKLTEEMNKDIKKAWCILDILEQLIFIEKEEKQKYIPKETEEMKEKLKKYLVKYYEAFRISLSEEIQNNKYLAEFPKKKAKINFQRLSELLSIITGSECKYVGDLI